jgi:hypothetical protein
MTTDYIATLESFGAHIAAGDDRASFQDFEKAELAYVKHSAVPSGAVAFATISPAFARGRFPELTLEALVLKRPHMDHREAAALAAVCGEPLPDAPAPSGFVDHLLDVIDRRALGAFYARYPERPASHSIDIRPRGIDRKSYDIDDAGLRDWHRTYGKLRTADPMMVATVMWLYCGSRNCPWLRRLLHGGHAAEAVRRRDPAGMLGDWAELGALYPGW